MTRLRGQLSAVDPMNLNQVILAEGKNSEFKSTKYNRNKKQISQTKRVALTGVMAALIAVTTIIAIPLPPPLSTINLAPVIIFVVCILLGPIIGVTSTVIGCGIGYLAGTSLGNNNCSAWIPVHLLGWFSGCQRSNGISCWRFKKEK